MSRGRRLTPADFEARRDCSAVLSECGHSAMGTPLDTGAFFQWALVPALFQPLHHSTTSHIPHCRPW
jgi:hypothetical protein